MYSDSMGTNPYLNAFLASAYIAAVASFMYFGPKNIGPNDSVLAPIVFLSVFVLSAAVMGYLFLSRPLQLFLEGNKAEAVAFFLKTVATFAVVTLILIALLVFFSA